MAEKESGKQGAATTLTAQALFDYAVAYCAAEVQAGRGTTYPLVREAAAYFRCRQKAIREVVDDYAGKGYLGIAVGFRVGNRIGTYSTQGEWRVEAYCDEEVGDDA